MSLIAFEQNKIRKQINFIIEIDKVKIKIVIIRCSGLKMAEILDHLYFYLIERIRQL